MSKHQVRCSVMTHVISYSSYKGKSAAPVQEDKKGEKVTKLCLIRAQEAHRTAWGEDKNKQRQHRKVSYKV